jgi:hypothetical protein
MQGKQTKRNASEPGILVRRGATVVGNLVEQESERFLTGIVPGRVWLGATVHARPDTGEASCSRVNEEILVETRFAASGSGKSAYF